MYLTDSTDQSCNVLQHDIIDEVSNEDPPYCHQSYWILINTIISPQTYWIDGDALNGSDHNDFGVVTSCSSASTATLINSQVVSSSESSNEIGMKTIANVRL